MRPVFIGLGPNTDIFGAGLIRHALPQWPFLGHAYGVEAAIYVMGFACAGEA